MRRWFCLLLAVCLMCTGCGWMDGNYHSVKPHQVGYQQPDPASGVLGKYSELRSAIADMIDSGEEEMVFTLYDYPEDLLHPDMEKVIAYCRSTDPVGAYAVEEIHYETGQNLLSVQIDYRRSKADIDRIHTVRGTDGAKDAIAQALKDCADSLVLQITGYTEVDFVQYAADYAALHPNIVMELPQITTQVYPQTGSVRILELQFSYQTSRESLRDMLSMVQSVFSSARLYVTGVAGEDVKLAQLYSFLMERYNYTIQTSITPGYSLLCHGVGDSRAFAQMYSAMCRQSGLEVVTVSGTYNGESRFWNIVRSGDTYYHVDLLRCAEQGYYSQHTDSEMGAYVWDYSAYPVCGEPIVVPTESSVPETTEFEEI